MRMIISKQFKVRKVELVINFWRSDNPEENFVLAGRQKHSTLSQSLRSSLRVSVIVISNNASVRM